MSIIEKKSLRKFQFFFGPITAIISFLVGYFGLNIFSISTTNNAVPALTFSILILLISHFFTIQKEVEKTTDELQKASIYSDKIYEAVKDNLHIIKLGVPITAIAYIESKIPKLVAANNPSINWGDEYTISEKKFYDTDKYDQFHETLCKNVGERTLFWREVGDGTAIERFRNTKKAAEAKSKPDRYQYKIISNNSSPQMNFIILEEENSKEVLFNWDFQSPGDTPKVLLSRDENIVKMFSVHFENLWKASNPDHDQDINEKE